MSDSRQRFEAWCEENSKYIQPADFLPWMEAAWQAAEAQTAKACAEIAGQLTTHYRDVYKGRTGDREQWHRPHTDGLRDGAGEVEHAIREAFPEAFK
jgi:hypothetical protein